jgi:hypothetical protein
VALAVVPLVLALLARASDEWGEERDDEGDGGDETGSASDHGHLQINGTRQRARAVER